MNIETLAKTYVAARGVVRTFGTPVSVDALQQRMRTIASSPSQCAELLSDLITLESHTRVMVLDEVVVLVKGA